MNNKNLTLFIQSLRGGGAERVCVTIANKLVSEGYSVQLIVLNLIDSVYHKNLNESIELINFNVNHARTSILTVMRYLLKNDIQEILVFNHELAIVLVFIRYILHKRFKIISRNTSTLSKKHFYEKSFWHKHVKSIFLKKIYPFVDCIIAQSETMKTDLISNYFIDRTKICVINNPLRPEIDKELFEKYGPVIAKKYEIVYIGRLESIKGINCLIDAFNIVLKKKPDLNLRIVGKGKLLEELIDYAKNLGLEKNIIFEGFKSDIIKFYKQAKLTVLSSLYEGFPNVLVESIALGTPVVAFDCESGPSEIIQDGVNGFLVRYRDVNHLAESIVKGLEHKWNIQHVQQTAHKYHATKIIQEYTRILNS